MKRIGSLGVSLLALSWLVGGPMPIAPSAHAELEGDRFIADKPWRIRISAPANWRPSEQRSYASVCLRATATAQTTECTRSARNRSQSSILLWMHRLAPAGEMLLAAERLQSVLTSRQYAEQIGAALAELGFTVQTPQLHAATGAYWIDFDNGTMFLRQAVLVAAGHGYSLTLSAGDQRTLAKHLRAFDYALRSIRITRGDNEDGDGDNENGGEDSGIGERRERDAKTSAPADTRGSGRGS
ncbi:MAG: hypothetical protein AAGC55_15825 [Myxococcota bacterium]